MTVPCKPRDLVFFAEIYIHTEPEYYEKNSRLINDYAGWSHAGTRRT
jgi:hypothetical protein